MNTRVLSPKQLEFISNSNAHWNLAHGSVRSGKTVCTLFRFLQAATNWPDSEIWIVGYSANTVYSNVIRPIFENPEFRIFRPFCTWVPGRRELRFMDKTIGTLGAKDEGAIGAFQGKTFSLVYCDELTLYPESIINMIDTRLSKKDSQGFASMNPSHPDHLVKKWINEADKGNEHYFALHFSLDDNPFIPESYKERLKQSLSGVFFKRFYLGEWCLAEGAIFDFFDRDLYTVSRPPAPAEYYIAGIDVGSVNPFACVLIGVNSGKRTGTGPVMWAHDEYYYDPKQRGKQQTNSEFARDIFAFLEPYGVQNVYIDPSAAAMKLELARLGIHTIGADNDVEQGIQNLTSRLKSGALLIMNNCKELIREIEGYVWDSKRAEKGHDEPLKKNDHCFSGDTIVSTERGPQAIKNILPGDKVFTSHGLKTVIRCGISLREAKEFFLHGRPIKCTPDHRFYTDRGWVEIQSLIQSDILFTSMDVWENTGNARQSPIKELNIGDIHKLTRGLNEIITAKTENIIIGSYGKIKTDRFPPDTIFITSTTTRSTMIYPICNVFHHQNMLSFIRSLIKTVRLHRKPTLQQPNGIKVRKGENGTENMLKNTHLENGRSNHSTASVAKKPTKRPSEAVTDFVQITVSLNGGEKLELTIPQEFVDCVEMNSFVTSMSKKNTALAPVLCDTLGKIPVYNLDVEDAHEFFAEGFLVHNSVDALRYAVNTHKTTARAATVARLGGYSYLDAKIGNPGTFY